MVRYLVEELGAQVDSAHNDGNTPLKLAQDINHKKVVYFLQRHMRLQQKYVDFVQVCICSFFICRFFELMLSPSFFPLL